MSHVVCLVRLEADRIDFTWSDGPDAFPTYALTGQADDLFREKVELVRERLRDLVTIYLQSLNEPLKGAESPDVRRASFALAQAGYDLRERAFRPTDDPGKVAKEVRKWLDGLHSRGLLESLEVVTEGAPSVPWNLLYESKPDEKMFLAGDPRCWELFWGLRYNLASGQRVEHPRRRMPWWEEPKVLLVVDPQVRAGLPQDQRERLEAFARTRGLPLIGSVAELEGALDALPGRRPDLLYWLGHASPEALILGDGDGSEITPSRLHELLEGDDEVMPGGLVFLNACRTAETSASAGSFFKSVFGLKMGGLIATEQQTVDTFAAPLGLDFLEAFLERGESVGAAMRVLRGRVPLGLLYGTYCPPGIRILRGETAQNTASAVDATAPLAGKALGPTVATAPQVPTAARVWPLPSHPYRSLRAYGFGDRALFAGRDDDVLRFARVLDDSGTRLLILHGESGVGKTSFLRAGVIPYLEIECIGYRFARDRSGEDGDPVFMVRATNDPVSQIASALNAYCAKPLTYRTPKGKEVAADLSAALRSVLEDRPALRSVAGDRDRPDALRDALCADPGLLGRVLAALAQQLPFTPVLVIDQAEEIFTLARTPADEENRLHALEMLRRSASGPGGFKLVVSLRTEYHGRFVDRLRKGARDTGGVREYLLTDFGLEALIDVIRRPTAPAPIPYASEVPFEKYHFRFADGVAEELARRLRAYTINKQDSVLPLAQVICTQLYELAKTRPDGSIVLADLEHIGGVAGGMKTHAEELVRRAFPNRADQTAFKWLLSDEKTQLYLRQSDGTLTTALLPAEFLARHWSGRTPFEQVLAAASDGDWRLLRVNSLRIGSDEQERPYVSLGHDALAKVAAAWSEELGRARRVRRYAVLAGSGALLATVMTALGLAAVIMAGKAAEAKKRADEQAERAVAAAEIATTERGKAESAKTRAEANERSAQRQLAESLLFQASILQNRQSVRAAGAKFWLAAETSRKLGHDPLAALFGLHQLPRRLLRPIFESDLSDTAALSDDGRWAFFVRDNQVQHQDILTGESDPLFPLADTKGSVIQCATSGDGRRVLSWSPKGSLEIWDVLTRTRLNRLPPLPPPAAVTSVAVSRDGTFVLVRGEVNRGPVYHVWKTDTPNSVPVFAEHKDRVRFAVMSADGRRVLACVGLACQVADATTGADLGALPGPAAIRAAALSPDGGHALVSYDTDDNQVALWNTATRTQVRKWNSNEAVSRLAFSRDGRRALAVVDDTTFRAWDLLSISGNDQELQGGYLDPYLGEPPRLTPDDGWMIIHSPKLTAWEIPTPTQDRRAEFGRHTALSALAISGNGRVIASGDNGRVRLWDQPTRAPLKTLLPEHSGTVTALAASEDGVQILFAVSGPGSNAVGLWDVSADRVRWVESLAPDPIALVALSRDGATAVYGTTAGTVRVRSADGSVHVLPRSPQITGNVQLVDLTISADGTTAAALCSTKGRTLQCQCWDLATRSSLPIPEGFGRGAPAIALSDDGGRAFSGRSVWDRATGSVRELDRPDGGPLADFDLHNERYRAALVDDGRLAIALVPAGPLAVWNAESGTCLFFESLMYWDIRMPQALSRDGRVLIAARGNSLLTLWNFTRLEERKRLGDAADAARKQLRARPDDAEAVRVIGEWCAVWDKHDWAIEYLERARAGRADDSRSLALARAYWQRGAPRDYLRRLSPVFPFLGGTRGAEEFPDPDLVAAEREFARALAATTEPAQRNYIRLCLQAVQAQLK